MSDDVKPALTAEEWAKDRFETAGTDSYDLSAWRESGTYHLSAAHCGCEISAEHYHKLAALALHGQPFGFTREDVAAIYRALESHELFRYTMQDEADALESLAARIEAMLPPEESNDTEEA